MFKKSKVFIIAIALCLMASVAMSGTLSISSPGGTIALEALNTSRTVTLGPVAANNAAVPSINNTGMSYALTQKLDGTNLLNISFTNARLQPASTVYICAANNVGVNGATVVGNFSQAVQLGAYGLVGANEPSKVIQISTSGLSADANPLLSVGNIIWFSSSSCSDVNNASFNINIAPTNTAGTVSGACVSINTGSVVLEPESCVNNIITTAREFTANLVGSDIVLIDFIDAPGDGTTLVVNAPGNNITGSGTNTTLSLTRSAVNYTCTSYGITMNGSVQLWDTASWNSMSQVYLVGAGNDCVAANSVTQVLGAAAITAARNNTAANIGGSTNYIMPVVNQASFHAAIAVGSYNFNLCVEANGTEIDPRTINGRWLVNPTPQAGTNGPYIGTTTPTLQTWVFNGYQGIIPYLLTNTNYPTYCAVTNHVDGNTQARIRLRVISVDGGTPVNSIVQNGVVVKAGLGILAFNGSSITLDGTQISNIGSVLGAGSRKYAMEVLLSVPRNRAFVSCFQTDIPAGGAKRPLPVFTYADDEAGNVVESKW
ncbi:MAG: hypothetical protein HQK76_09935 [Desulfobacterales bacterium]|nr:hypothetical protein [Desulfobacterales bacterium]